MDNSWLICLITLTWISLGQALECFVCDNQDSNTDKCIKTTKQCEENEDICISRIRWGIPPYWTPRGDRIYKLSKDCSVKSQCDREMREAITTCKRDWYDDWACVECCSGDMCNYYITMGASSLRPSVLFASTIISLSVLLKLV